MTEALSQVPFVVDKSIDLLDKLMHKLCPVEKMQVIVSSARAGNIMSKIRKAICARHWRGDNTLWAIYNSLRQSLNMFPEDDDLCLSAAYVYLYNLAEVLKLDEELKVLKEQAVESLRKMYRIKRDGGVDCSICAEVDCFYMYIACGRGKWVRYAVNLLSSPPVSAVARFVLGRGPSPPCLREWLKKAAARVAELSQLPEPLRFTS